MKKYGKATVCWWVLLIVALGLIAGVQSRPVQRWLTESSRNAADAAVGLLQLDIVSKLAVGTKAISPSADNAMKLFGDIEKSATTNGLKVRAAIVAGELLGANEAIQRLDKLLDGTEESGQIDFSGNGFSSEAMLLKEWYEYKVNGEEGFDLLVRWSELGRPLDWYVDLASVYGLPNDEPFRKTLIDDAIRAVFAIGFAVMVIFGGLLLGLILLVVGLVLYYKGILKPKFKKRIEKRPVYLGTMTIFLLLMIGLSLTAKLTLFVISDDIVYEQKQYIGWALKLMLYAGMPMALLYPIIRGTKCGVMKKDVGWHCGGDGFVGFLKEIGAGIIGYLAGLPLVALSVLLAAILSKVTGEQGGHPIVSELSDGRVWLIVFALAMAIIWAPLVEESVFRGVFFAHMRRRCGFWWSAIVVAFVFAAIHPQSLVGLPPIMALSIVFTVMREWRGSLIGPMFAHAMHNGMVTIFVLVIMH
ncbi:CPBP family intramembrane metalloprotease [Planctomycetota bacterium]|nr:CPBP family intramembrane metalloprotease [Planctomycetota bacterium]